MNPFKLLGLSLFLTSIVLARPPAPLDWRGSPGWEPEGAYCRLYDAKTVVTVSGTIEKVEKVVPMKGMGTGVHFLLNTPKELIPVQLGPEWFMDKQSVKVQAKETVEVTGSRVPCDGKNVILASEVKRGADVLKLRDASGKPTWSIWQVSTPTNASK